MSVPEGGYHNSKTKTTSCDKCISEHIVSRQKAVENRNTRRGDKNIVHWQYDFDRSTSLSRHWNDIYPILLGMIDDKNINLHKLKSGYMPSDVNNKIIQEFQQMLFIRGNRLRSNMSLQFFYILIFLELVQSISNWCIKLLVHPKWHPANDDDCYKFLLKSNSIIEKTHYQLRFDRLLAIYEISIVLLKQERNNMPTDIENWGDSTPMRLRIGDWWRGRTWNILMLH